MQRRVDAEQRSSRWCGRWRHRQQRQRLQVRPAELVQFAVSEDELDDGVARREQELQRLLVRALVPPLALARVLRVVVGARRRLELQVAVEDLPLQLKNGAAGWGEVDGTDGHGLSSSYTHGNESGSVREG